MAQGFYELLSVDRGANPDDVRAAYQRQLASLVRRLRAAHRQSADVSVLEGQERALKEAMEVLSDPVRRRRYDAYLAASDDRMPDDAESLWERSRAGLVDPAAAAALEVVRALTDLPLGAAAPLPEIEDAPTVRPTLPRTIPREPAVSSEPVQRPSAPRPPAAVAAGPLPPVIEMPRPGPAIEHDEALPTEEQTWELYEDDEVLPAPPPLSRRAPEPPPRPRDPIAALEERFGLDGRYLRGVRELKGVPLEEVARTTRISQRYLEAIEENSFDSLPASTFVRGYVRSMARLLSLDESAVTEGYMALFTHHRG